MLNIYASAIRIATRTAPGPVPKAPKKSARPEKWLPKGHWWLQAARSIDETLK